MLRIVLAPVVRLIWLIVSSWISQLEESHVNVGKADDVVVERGVVELELELELERRVDVVKRSLSELELDRRVDEVPLVVTVNTSVEVLVMMMFVLEEVDEAEEGREAEADEDTEEARDARELELLTVDRVGDLLELDEDTTGIILKYMVMEYKFPLLASTSKTTGTVRPTKASGGSI